MRLWVLILVFVMATHQIHGRDEIVLLHGLARTSRSMGKMESALSRAGYRTVNIGYKSRSATIEELAVIVRKQILERARSDGKLHFVTHSMGGILLRQIQKTDPLPNLGRVVMIAPPNQGSEVVDALGETWCFKVVNGPAGRQLGTEADGFVARLGSVGFELGVIAGDRTMDPILSRLISGENDGKVSVERTKIEGMQDFLVVGFGHTFITSKRPVIEATLRFLRSGQFAAEA